MTPAKMETTFSKLNYARGTAHAHLQDFEIDSEMQRLEGNEGKERLL